MKNLKIWQKLALMGAVFMLPFAAVTYKMVASVHALGMDVAQRELNGLALHAPMLQLVKQLQLHRGMTNASLRGETGLAGALPEARADVERGLAAVEPLNQKLTLLPEERWTAWRDAARQLLVQSGGLNADESFARHSRLIADAIAMIGEAGHESKLTLDPDVSRAHLVDALVFAGPALAETISRAGGFGIGVATAKARTPDQMQRLQRDAVLVEYLGARLDEAMNKAIEGNESLRAGLEAPATAASDAVLDAMSDIVRLSSERGTVDAAQFFATQSRGVDAIVGLELQMTTVLEGLLDVRLAALRRELTTTIGLAALGLIIVSLIGFLIMRDITGPLRGVVEVAARFAVGDFSTTSAASARGDEIGELVRGFERMGAAAGGMALVAERIAAGDLSVPVTPRSPRDVIGLALKSMTERLQTLLGDVHRSGIQVNTSVNDIAVTARQQQATASEIAATTSEIGATSKQISATSKELVKTMGEVAEVADQTATLAGTGQVGLTRMESTMTHVMDAAGSINAKLAVLNEKAGNINQVVTTITKVADQTNLLSLNAAIEAEKAGEYGRGFAVVATEIRRLADQTAVATYDIEQMVKEIQSAVAAGVMGMDKFSEEVRRGMQEMQNVAGQLSLIIQQVQALAPRVDAVNEGVRAQATGAEQITQALAQLSDAAQQTVESLRQSGSAIDGLNLAASGMHTGVSRFKLAA
jgi:methyl-accepting chemotaxis protein WspA